LHKENIWARIVYNSKLFSKIHFDQGLIVCYKQLNMQKNSFKNNLKQRTVTENTFKFGLATAAILATFVGLIGLFSSLQNSTQIAQAASEPTCQNVTTDPTWNPYPINTNFPNPTFAPNDCKDIPMLSFFPVDTAAGNPREKTITKDDTITLQVYYNNGARPGSSKILNPKLKVQVIKETETKYRIKGLLEGTNSSPANSRSKGGDLIVNTPSGTRFNILGSSTNHYPTAIIRKEQADLTGQRPFDNIPDNSQSGSVSNPIYSAFEGANLASNSGFSINSTGVDAGFLGYGFVLSQISIKVNAVSINTPPQIPGQEITIIRGQSGSFTPLNPTDPENDIPISLDLTKIPSFCTLQGQSNATGGGQTISCQTTAQTPVKTTFVITPTDSKGLVGTPGTFIVNVIDPSVVAIKTCVKKGTTTSCNQAQLKGGDEILYQIETKNTSQVGVTNFSIVDTFDGNKLTKVSNASDNGVINTANSTVTWTDLGPLAANVSKTVSFEATISNDVKPGDLIKNVALVKPRDLPEISTEVSFVVSGATLISSKDCVVKGTSNACNKSILKPGDSVTYRITVTNNGNLDVNNVKVVDSYDGTNLMNIRNINPTGALDLNLKTVTWSVGTLKPNANAVLGFDATIISGILNGTNIPNVAVISGDGVPNQTVRADFVVTVVLVTIETPRTGGETALILIAIGTTLVGFGFILYQKYGKKLNRKFVPERNTQAK